MGYDKKTLSGIQFSFRVGTAELGFKDCQFCVCLLSTATILLDSKRPNKLNKPNQTEVKKYWLHFVGLTVLIIVF